MSVRGRDSDSRPTGALDLEKGGDYFAKKAAIRLALSYANFARQLAVTSGKAP
jgi:hypothetical protein